ncbi:PRC and DUF2382 domain-containing protein [Citricoccus nitrophenolicus]|uniref:PRC and DUF2382 domain-containing protein n=1 Tax=Citricoccus nitrophenolicus TaxID=863575 RepID=UPI0031EEB3F6
MQDFTSVEKLQDATVYGTDGDKIGSVGQVYLDDQTNQPTFVTVSTGLFGTKETFIPISKATPSQDGLQVPFDKAFVKDAPNIDTDGSLTPQDERRLYEYYSMDYQGTDTGGDTDAARGTTAGGGVAGQDSESVVARDEQLNVGTETRESGQVRLRKHSYTDTETVEVPVAKEEVVVEREAVDPNSPEALQDTGDEEVVVTAREEVPVVDKTATAEKVTVDKNRMQDTEQVAGTVQHEDVEVQGEDDTGRRR